jgi:hypothetical protein
MWFNTPRDPSKMPAELFRQDEDDIEYEVSYVNAETERANEDFDDDFVDGDDSETPWELFEVVDTDQESDELGPDGKLEEDERVGVDIEKEGEEGSSTASNDSNTNDMVPEARGGATVSVPSVAPIQMSLPPKAARNVFALTCITMMFSLIGGAVATDRAL